VLTIRRMEDEEGCDRVLAVALGGMFSLEIRPSAGQCAEDLGVT
jgi:hypothetical protein